MILDNVRIATMQRGYDLIENGAVVVEGARIGWVGPAAQAPAGERRNGGGRLLTPGLIDCHTHLVYGGSRAGEFEMRLNGASYAEIAKAGGGIVSTLKATRAATEAELFDSAARRLKSLLAEG